MRGSSAFALIQVCGYWTPSRRGSNDSQKEHFREVFLDLESLKFTRTMISVLLPDSGRMSHLNECLHGALQSDYNRYGTGPGVLAEDINP